MQIKKSWREGRCILIDGIENGYDIRIILYADMTDQGLKMPLKNGKPERNKAILIGFNQIQDIKKELKSGMGQIQ